MNNFFTLTKVFFLSGFNVNRKKKNQKSAFALLGLTLLLFVAASVYFSYVMFIQFKETGINPVLSLALFLFLAMCVNFVLSMYQLQSILFNTKDFEFLESLPVSKTCIVASKLTATYLINLAEDLALIVPAVIFFYALGGEILPGIITITFAFFVSFVPILISSVIGAISALLSARSKHSNIINITVSLIFFGLLFAGYMYMIYSGPEAMLTVTDKIFFIKWMNMAIVGMHEYLLYSILFNLGAAIIVVLMIALIYRPVNSWMNAGGIHTDYEKVKKEVKTENNIYKLLIKKEWKLITGKPIYFINSILGMLFFLILSLTFIFLPNMFVHSSEDLSDIMPTIAAVFVSFIPGMGLIMNSIQSCASTLVSMEGKFGIEMLKSYPIDSKYIIRAKLFLALIIEMIINLFISIIVVIAMIFKGYTNPELIIAVFLYPQLAAATHSLCGTLVGVRWPKLEFENDSQVYKNSAAANLPLLFAGLPSMLVVAGQTVLIVYGMQGYYFLNYVAVGAVCAIYAIAIVLLSIFVNKKAPNMFDNIIK